MTSEPPYLPRRRSPVKRVAGRRRHRMWEIGLSVWLVALTVMWLGANPRVIMPVVAVIVVALVAAARIDLSRLRWAPPTLDLPASAGLGERIEVVYRRRAVRPRSVPAGAVVLELALVCTETVVRGSGRNRRVETATVCRRVTRADATTGRAGITAVATVEIPLDEGAPTMDLGDNVIVWRLEARLEGEGAPHSLQIFPVTVVAVLDARVGGPGLADHPPVWSPGTDPTPPSPARWAPDLPVTASPAVGATGDNATDPAITLTLDGSVVEVRGYVRGFLARRGTDDDLAQPGESDRVSDVQLRLRCRTHGRGNVDRVDVGPINFALDEFGRTSGSFTLLVPPGGPISYDGRLIQVIWEVEAKVDVRWATDRSAVVPVLIVPRGGAGPYRSPHPLR